MNINNQAPNGKIAKLLLNSIWVVPLILIIFFFIEFDNAAKHKYEENSKSLKITAPYNFESETGFKIPKDSELLHISTLEFGFNVITNIVYRIPNINSFSQSILEKYSFDIGNLKYPYFDGKLLDIDDYNIFAVPLCHNQERFKDSNLGEAVIAIELNDFCESNESMLSLIYRETEIGKVLAIIPEKNLVWLNTTYWF